MLDTIMGTPAAFVSFLAAIIAACTSIFLALWARRTQKYLTLQQLELQKELERNVTEFKDSLERNRMIASFSRNRIIEHVDRVLSSYIEISSLSRHVRRMTWTDSHSHLEGDTQFGLALHCLRAHFNVLEAFKVIPEKLINIYTNAVTTVESEWASAYGEMYLDTPEYRKTHPNGMEFSSDRFKKKVEKLETAVSHLGEAVCSIPAKIRLPE